MIHASVYTVLVQIFWCVFVYLNVTKLRCRHIFYNEKKTFNTIHNDCEYFEEISLFLLFNFQMKFISLNLSENNFF